jgi:hypothetical protein
MQSKAKSSSNPCSGLSQTLRVPEDWGSQISRQLAHEGGKAVSPTHRPPLFPRKYSWYSFLLLADSTPGLQCGRKEYVNLKFQWPHRESNPWNFICNYYKTKQRQRSCLKSHNSLVIFNGFFLIHVKVYRMNEIRTAKFHGMNLRPNTTETNCTRLWIFCSKASELRTPEDHNRLSECPPCASTQSTYL